jgi:trigger factor
MNVANVKVQSSDGCRKEVFAEVPKDDVQVVFQQVFKDISRSASIPGFRKGKAPSQIIEKQYTSIATEETIKRIIPNASSIAWEKLHLIPVGIPKITKIDYAPGTSLQFSMVADVAPVVNLPEYKNIKVKVPKVEVKQENIQQALQHLQEEHSSFTKVTTRPIQTGDAIRCDMSFIPSVELAEQQRYKNATFLVDASSNLWEILLQTVGLSTGDTKEIEAKIPEKVGEQQYWGKNARFKVHIKEIMEKKLSDINDEFAKKLGASNLDELNNIVKKEIELDIGRRVAAYKTSEIINYLIEKTNMELPKSLVEAELKRLARDEKIRCYRSGTPIEKIKEQEKDILERLKPTAGTLVKQHFLLMTIAQKENLLATEEEIEKEILKLADYYKKKPNEIRKTLEKNDAIGGLYDRITNEKTIDFLIKNAEEIEEDSRR